MSEPKPLCRHFDEGRCRSCEQMGIPLSQRIARAETELSELLRIAVEPTFQGPAFGFRDKIKIVVSGTSERPLLGLLLPDLATGIELIDCPVQAPALNAELPGLIKFISKWNLTPYHVPSKRGELKGLILSWSPTTGEKTLRFVLRSKEALDRIRLGLAELDHFTVVSVNLQPIPHAILEGPDEIILTPKKHITHQTSGPALFFSPQSFMQTNSVVASALYATATAWLAPWREERALDLYCGVGGFALHLRAAGMQVMGVERNPSAASVASLAALHNQLKVEFLARDAAGIDQLWTSWSPEVVVVNPPRRGLADALDLIEHKLPKILLYSSCSPTSLAIDLKRLAKHYDAKRAKIFDMFPHTNHFESLALLVRR